MVCAFQGELSWFSVYLCKKNLKLSKIKKVVYRMSVLGFEF